jgi:hypothetical protein
LGGLAQEEVMLKGFIMPEKARITKVIINGIERLIDPPIEIEAGEVIHIPYESAQQSPAGQSDVAIAPITEEESQHLSMLELDIRSNSANR